LTGELSFCSRVRIGWFMWHDSWAKKCNWNWSRSRFMRCYMADQSVRPTQPDNSQTRGQTNQGKIENFCMKWHSYGVVRWVVLVLVVQKSQVEWANKHANILQALGTYNVRKVRWRTLNPCKKVKCMPYMAKNITRIRNQI